jgi:HPt (histidine-containing phosphotransfer) domain-containing protein
LKKDTSHSPSENNPLDLTILDSIRSLQKEGKPNILEKAIRLYFSYTPKLLKNIQKAISKKDAKTVDEEAHSLKTSAAQLGATKLSMLCKELEIMGRKNSLKNAEELLLKIETEYEAVRVALENELERIKR